MRTFVGVCRLHVDAASYQTVENTPKTQNTLSKVIVLVGLATVGAAAAEPSDARAGDCGELGQGRHAFALRLHACTGGFPAEVCGGGGAILELPKQVRPAAGQLFIASADAMTPNGK